MEYGNEVSNLNQALEFLPRRRVQYVLNVNAPIFIPRGASCVRGKGIINTS